MIAALFFLVAFSAYLLVTLLLVTVQVIKVLLRHFPHRYVETTDLSEAVLAALPRPLVWFTERVTRP